MNRVAIAALLAAAIACRPTQAGDAERRVRPPASAGQFYPSDPQVLASEVKRLVGQAPRTAEAKGRIVLTPHAGLAFSGAIAAAAFRQLDAGFDRAVIIAANHDGRFPFQGFSVDRATHYAVPGLEVRVAAAARELAARPGAVDIPAVHGMHMVEIELPFLREVNGGRPFEIVPVIVGSLDLAAARALAGELAKLALPGTVFVFSVDLSHYHPYDLAQALDRPCLDAIVRMDMQEVARCDTDGTQVLAAMVNLAAQLGTTPRLVAYANSGDVSGDRSRVVGYGAIAFEDRLVLTPGEKTVLVSLARASLERAVREGRPADLPPEIGRFPRLTANRASFVTLKIAGQLRGCIGSLEARAPLAEDVARNAALAALRDRRFAPVRAEELKRIRVSVSVLDDPRPLEAHGVELLRRLEAGRPGLVMEVQGRSSTFLPAVWEELPDPAQFLAALCVKQGSPETCWTRPDAQFRTYSAEEIGEGIR